MPKRFRNIGPLDLTCRRIPNLIADDDRARLGITGQYLSGLNLHLPDPAVQDLRYDEYVNLTFELCKFCIICGQDIRLDEVALERLFVPEEVVTQREVVGDIDSVHIVGRGSVIYETAEIVPNERANVHDGRSGFDTLQDLRIDRYSTQLWYQPSAYSNARIRKDVECLISLQQFSIVAHPKRLLFDPQFGGHARNVGLEERRCTSRATHVSTMSNIRWLSKFSRCNGGAPQVGSCVQYLVCKMGNRIAAASCCIPHQRRIDWLKASTW